jgi:adenylylsulfate kinase-like enzyme
MSATTPSPGTIWITGLSASGKTSVGRGLASRLQADAYADLVLLDGDEFRARLQRKYGHSLQDRVAVLNQLVEAARTENVNGRAVIVTTISHKRAMREHARRRIGHFMEVYLDCPVEVCSSRDPHGFYRRAFAGEYTCFPGVTEPYERSANTELVLDTAASSIDTAVQRLLPEALAFLGAPARPPVPEPARNIGLAYGRLDSLRRRGGLDDGECPMWETGYRNISVRVREHCSQLFYVYAGVSGLPGMNGVRFLHEAKLVDRNLAMIRDPYNEDFMSGVGDGIDDIEKLLDWHEACQRRLEHVSEIYCIGNSMGGYAAVLFAHLLGAKAAWAFALRPFGGKPMLEELSRMLASGTGATTYHLYFSSHEPDDQQIAESLAPRPGVVLHPLTELTDLPHMVMVALSSSGRLGTLFPPFRGVPSAR